MTRRDFLIRAPVPLVLGSTAAGQIALAAQRKAGEAMGTDPITGIAEQPGDLAAKQAITELVHRYGQVVRRDFPELTADLYTPDGVFEVRQGTPDRDEYTVQSRVEGREAIRAMLLPSKGKPHPVPLIHNLIIEVDPGGATATGGCIMQSPVSASGQPFWGEYRDSFAKVDGRWYFTQRVFTMFANP